MASIPSPARGNITIDEGSGIAVTDTIDGWPERAIASGRPDESKANPVGLVKTPDSPTRVTRPVDESERHQVAKTRASS